MKITLLDEYILNLSREKELDADPKVIQQIEFIRHIKKLDGVGNNTEAGND